MMLLQEFHHLSNICATIILPIWDSEVHFGKKLGWTIMYIYIYFYIYIYINIYIYTWVIDPHFFPSLLGDLLIPCLRLRRVGFCLHQPIRSIRRHAPLGTCRVRKRLVRLRLFSCNLQQIFLNKKGSYISAKKTSPNKSATPASTKIGVSKTLQVFRSQGHNSLNGGYSYHPFFNAWWQQLLKGSYNQRPFFDATFMLQFSTQGTPEAPDIKVMQTMRTPRF